MRKPEVTRDVDIDEYLEALIRKEYKKQLNYTEEAETIEA